MDCQEIDKYAGDSSKKMTETNMRLNLKNAEGIQIFPDRQHRALTAKILTEILGFPPKAYSVSGCSDSPS